jgi:hypothetical protein
MSNSETAPRVHVSEMDAEWAAFDALPKGLRVCLREAMQDYSAEQVLEDYQRRLSASRESSSIADVFGWGSKPDPIRDIARNIHFLDQQYAEDYRAELLSQRVRLKT